MDGRFLQDPSCWNQGSHSSGTCELPRPQILPRGSVGQTSPGLGATSHSARFLRRVFTAAESAAPSGCSSHSAPASGRSGPGALRGRPFPNSLFGPLLGVASRRRRTSFQSMTDPRAAAPAFANRSPRQPAQTSTSSQPPRRCGGRPAAILGTGGSRLRRQNGERSHRGERGGHTHSGESRREKRWKVMFSGQLPNAAAPDCKGAGQGSPYFYFLLGLGRVCTT